MSRRPSLAELLRRIETADPELLHQLAPYMEQGGALRLINRIQASDIVGASYEVVRRWSDRGVVQPTAKGTKATPEWWDADAVRRLSVVVQLHRIIGAKDHQPLEDAWKAADEIVPEYIAYRIFDAWVIGFERPPDGIDYVRLDGGVALTAMNTAQALIDQENSHV